MIKHGLPLLLFVVIWGVLIAVADMNWPQHMGGPNPLMVLLGLN